MLFSRRNVNMAADVDFISMSRNGQLTGFCHALPNFNRKLREHSPLSHGGHIGYFRHEVEAMRG